MATIQQSFSQLNLKITPEQIHKFHDMVLEFELRGTHPLTLNSQVLGVYKIAFTDRDREGLYELFHVSETSLKKAIRQCTYIQPHWHTLTNPFNMLCVWLMHLSYAEISNLDLRHQFLLDLAKYLHYSFFTSLINWRWKYPADEAVMIAVINDLSRKFDIINRGTWRKTIEARAEDMISDSSTHYKAIMTAADDVYFTRILSDAKTRLTDKINKISEAYYEYKDHGIRIESSSATRTDKEGQKILVQRATTFEQMSTSVVQDLLNVHVFLNTIDINGVATQFDAISPALLRAALEVMSGLAARQNQSKQLSETKTINGVTHYIGMKILVERIIQVSFRYCVNNQISLKKNPLQIWDALRNVYSSSRINDPDILSVKMSMGYFVDSIGKTSREATKASLRIALIMYIIRKCLRFL